MATKATEPSSTPATVEFSIWYNSPDGVRRELRALDKDGVTQAIADIHADENRRQQLAASVGLHVDPLELGIEIFKTTTTTEQVEA
jgi:hypothetical protein